MNKKRYFRAWMSRLFMLIAGLALTTSVSAVVLKPQLDVTQLGADAGVVSAGGILTMDATTIGIINPDNSFTDIVDVDFFLSASGSSGSLNAGGLLTADFTNFAVQDLGGGFATFFADLQYTGGTLAGALIAGRIEGSFFLTSGSFATDFTAAGLTSKLGPIAAIPVPAAFPLMLGALAGLGAFRRKS